MSRYEIILRKIDEEDKSFDEIIFSGSEDDMIKLKEIPKEKLVDMLEIQVFDSGFKIMRQLYTHFFELFDKKISDTREHKDSSCQVRYEGYEKIKIISRLGILEPERQVCKCMKCNDVISKIILYKTR
jgi:hypothetical protein